MSYMLREEAFHMGTGNDGLRRIVQAGIIPAWLIQKYLNKWISCSYDLFGTDHSSSAHWAYVWGIKGRYDEPKNETPPSSTNSTTTIVILYRDEVAGLVERLNSVPQGGQSRSCTRPTSLQPRHRPVGGTEVSRQDRRTARTTRNTSSIWEVMPTAEDKKVLLEIIANEKKWIAEKEGARDPFDTIGEPRKSAINFSSGSGAKCVSPSTEYVEKEPDVFCRARLSCVTVQWSRGKERLVSYGVRSPAPACSCCLR